MSPFELVKLAVLVGFIGWAMLRKLHHIVLCALGVFLGTDILDLDLGPTVNGPQLVGLLYLPWALPSLGRSLRTGAGRAWIGSLVLLAALAFLYGYWDPWPDKTGERPWNQRAEGRSLINLSATIAYTSLSLYIAERVQEVQFRQRLPDYLLIATTVAAAGVVLEVVTQTDLHSYLAPGRRDWVLGEAGRARGFNIEPRHSGGLAAMGAVLLLRPGLLKSPRRVSLLVLHGVALLMTTSTLALILFGFGTIALTLVTGRLDILATVTVAASAVILGVSAWFGGSPMEMWREHTGQRIDKRDVVVEASSLGDVLVGSLEVFDASAVNFLLHRPEHLVLGTGPGLVSLPASDFVPDGPGRVIFGDRIDSIPHMGLIRVIADTGLVGLLLWLLNAVFAMLSLSQCQRAEPNDPSWRLCRIYFFVFTGLFLLQLRPVWYVWLGVGLGAAIYRRQLQMQKRIPPSEQQRKPQLVRGDLRKAVTGAARGPATAGQRN